MAGQLDGKVAVVTGGGSGIGAATALQFAAEGAAVVVADIRPEPGQETVAAITAAGGRATFVQTDTSKASDNEAMAQTALDTFGRLDILMAAAGVSHGGYTRGEPLKELGSEDRTVLQVPLEDWARVLSINLTGVMLSDRACARRMVDQGEGGAIVNVASMNARLPFWGHSDYCVSKAGVWMLTKCLALELAPNDIRVNAIGPGGVDTPMIAGVLGEMAGQISAGGSVSRAVGRPEEIASTALFLASEASSFVTGQILFAAGTTFTGS